MSESRNRPLRASATGTTFDQPVNEYPGNVHGVGVYRIDDLFDFGDGHRGGLAHGRIEVSSALIEDEVALGVRLPSLDQGEVARYGLFHDVVFPAERSLLSGLADQLDLRTNRTSSTDRRTGLGRSVAIYTLPSAEYLMGAPPSWISVPYPVGV